MRNACSDGVECAALTQSKVISSNSAVWVNRGSGMSMVSFCNLGQYPVPTEQLDFAADSTTPHSSRDRPTDDSLISLMFIVLLLIGGAGA